MRSQAGVPESSPTANTRPPARSRMGPKVSALAGQGRLLPGIHPAYVRGASLATLRRDESLGGQGSLLATDPGGTGRIIQEIGRTGRRPTTSAPRGDDAHPWPRQLPARRGRPVLLRRLLGELQGDLGTAVAGGPPTGQQAALPRWGSAPPTRHKAALTDTVRATAPSQLRQSPKQNRAIGAPTTARKSLATRAQSRQASRGARSQITLSDWCRSAPGAQVLAALLGFHCQRPAAPRSGPTDERADCPFGAVEAVMLAVERLSISAARRAIIYWALRGLAQPLCFNARAAVRMFIHRRPRGELPHLPLTA
jgi:hypothetical protein